MALMTGSAGELEVKLNSIGIDKQKLCLSGQIGVWDSQIYLERGEVVAMAKQMFKLAVLKYVVCLPFASLADKFKSKQGTAGTGQ